jgi:PAS domain S-box-containing protein
VFALLGWRHRNITISLPFTLLMAALTIWFYGYVLELLSPDLPWSLVFNNIEVPFTLVVPVAFLLLVLYYTGHETFVSKKNILLLFIVPVIITLLEFTNPFHALYYTRFYPVPSDGMVIWMHDYGPFFWLGAAYTYSLITLSLVLIIAGLIGTGRHQRRSLYLLLIASAVPVVMNLLFIFRIISPRGLDLTPFAFLVTGLILAFGLFRYLLFSMPVAYKQVVHQMLDGVIITSGPSIIDLNPSAERMTGVRAGDAVGKDIAEVLPGLAPCIAGTGLFPEGSRTECTFTREGGQPAYFDVIAMPLGRAVTGSGAGLFLLHDITERKKAGLALGEANRKIGLLSSITRHDVRNQLTALNAYLMLSEELPEDPKDQAEYIRMEKLIVARIEHQISFTKFYEELGVNAPAWQDPGACIRQAMDGLSLGGIRVEIGFDSTEVYADPLLEKVFYNLIDNALRYGGPGLTEIRITRQNPDSWLELVFEDNGAGVAPEDRARLFDKGFGKNTGFGLFLSREILSLTGITITEDGRPGAGALFVIRFPAGTWRVHSTR